MNPYTSYYLNQAQTGLGSIPYAHQTGHGLGNWIGKLYQSLLPLVKNGFTAIRDELFSGGVGILTDTFKQVPLKDSLQNRVRTMGSNLTDRAVAKVGKMTGSGVYKPKTKKKNIQSGSASKKKKTTNKKSSKKPKTKKKTTKKPVKRLQTKKKKGSNTKKKAKKVTTKKKSLKKNCNQLLDIFS